MTKKSACNSASHFQQRWDCIARISRQVWPTHMGEPNLRRDYRPELDGTTVRGCARDWPRGRARSNLGRTLTPTRVAPDPRRPSRRVAMNSGPPRCWTGCYTAAPRRGDPPIEGNSYRLREHADLIPEHLRGRSLREPAPVVELRRRPGRPRKEHAASPTG